MDARYNLVATVALTVPDVDDDGNPITNTITVGATINTIIWDGVTALTLPEGTQLELATD